MALRIGELFAKFETSKLLTLNDTGGFSSGSLSSYNSSTFVDGNGATTGGTIAYVSKNVKGYSRSGFYVGNGNTDGASIYTELKIMIKSQMDQVTGYVSVNKFI